MAKSRQRWYKDAAIYQIYPRSFKDSNNDGIGDLKGIISKLDYLEYLGIDAVWLGPVYKSPNDDNGYDISDYRQIMEEFGTLDDWKELIAGLHQRNIKLMMDLVVNHTSDEHTWFKQARADVKSPYRDYYFFRRGKKVKFRKKLKKPNNWTSFFGGSAWEYNEATDDYYLHLFSKKQPDLNFNNPKVIQEVKSIMEYWLKLGVDGFRCDVINILSKYRGLLNGKGHIALVGKEYYLNGPRIHDLLHEFNKDVLAKYNAYTVGEGVMMTLDIAPSYTREDRQELDSIFFFEHMDVDNHFGIKYLRRKFKLSRFKNVFFRWQKGMYNVGWNSLYLENHDQPRCVGRFGTSKEPQYRELGAKMLATMMYFQQGTAYVYQGQEIGMTSGDFTSVDQLRDREALNMLDYAPKLGVPKFYIKKSVLQKGRDNARTPMQWDTSQNAGFSEAQPWIGVNPNYLTINVEAAKQDPNSILQYYRKLLKIRKGNPIVLEGKYEEYYRESETIYVYARILKTEAIVVIANFTNTNQPFNLMAEFKDKKNECLIANYPGEHQLEDLTLRPYEAMAFHVDLEK